MSAQVEKLNANEYRLNGELNMYSVSSLSQALLPSMRDGAGEICVDLAGVSHSDSAGLALLIEWMHQARERNTKLRFANLPAQLREIAQISDLLPILPLD